MDESLELWHSKMWEIKEVDSERVKEIENTLEISLALARVLALRIKNVEEAKKFLFPKLSSLASPSLLPDMEKSVKRIIAGIDKKESILLWGHDDLDGMAGVTSLYEVLKDLGAIVSYYIPDRTKEKHGLGIFKLKTFVQEGIKLVITIDCGITNFSETEEAEALGMDVIITDHHQITEKIPKAFGIVTTKNPESPYPYGALAGCGVALKLGMGLVHCHLGLTPEEFLSAKKDLLGFTALGTIGDRVPLLGENRILAKYGLEVLKKSIRPVIEVIRKFIGIDPSDMNPHKIISLILPLFSSAYAGEGVKFLLSKNKEEAENFISLFSQRNEKWKKEAFRALTKAREKVEIFDKIVISYDENIPIRTLGFCASKLRDEFSIPAIVMGLRGDEWVGETRGMEGLNLVELLKKCSSELIDYGGHLKAAGFSLKGEKMQPFIDKVQEYAAEHFDVPAIVKEEVKADAILPLNELTSQFRNLRPFGEANPSPLFISPKTLWAGKESDILYTIDENLRVHIKATTPST